MRYLPLRLMGWVLAVLAVALLMLRARAPEENVPDRIAIRAYPVEDAAVTFALQGDESTVRLIVWLEGEGWTEFNDVRHTIPYGFDVAVVGEGDEDRWTQSTWVRARRTLEEREGKVRTPTWVEGAPYTISEDRLHHFDIGEVLDGPATFEVRPTFIPEGSRMLVIAFRDGARDRFQAMRVRRGALTDPQRRVERLGLWRWGELPDDWRERIALEEWERMGAMPPDEGVVVPTHELMTRFHRIPWEDAPSVATAIAPGGAAAFNTEGEAILRFTWWSMDGDAPVSERSFVRIVNRDGTGEVWESSLAEVGPIRVTDTVESVQIALHPDTDGPRYLRTVTEGPEVDRSYGDPPRTRIDELQWAAPDFRNVELYRLDRELSPVLFRVKADERVRVMLRRRMDPAPLPAFWPPPALPDGSVVLIEELDADGRLIELHEVALEPVPSAFERYTEGDHGMSARVAEPETRYLIPANRTAWLRLSANATVDASVRTTTDGAPSEIVDPSYVLPEDFEFSMTYEPHIRDPWRHRGAEQIDALLYQGRVIRVDAQVRPEWREARVLAKPKPRLDKSALPLPRPFELVAEPDRDGVVAAGGRHKLSAAARGVDVGPTGRLMLDYRVPVDQVGQTIALGVDGASVPITLPAAGGNLRLDGLSAGAHALSVDSSGAFFAPATGGAGWQVRKAYRLNPGEELIIDVPGGGSGVSVYPYTVARAATMTWWLEADEGLPTGLFQGETASRGSLVLAAESGRTVIPLSFDDPGLTPLRPLHLTLRDDVPEIGARLHLQVEPDQEAWVRVLTTWAERVPDGNVHWPMGPPHVVVVGGE